MNISRISNQNFGKFESWEFGKDIPKFSEREKQTLKNIEIILNQKYGDKLRMFGKVDCPDMKRPYTKYVRLVTAPLGTDLAIIKIHRPEAVNYDYKRVSQYAPLYDRFLSEKLLDFVDGQKRYINYCVHHLIHNLKRPSVQKHEF